MTWTVTATAATVTGRIAAEGVSGAQHGGVAGGLGAPAAGGEPVALRRPQKLPSLRFPRWQTGTRAL